MSLFNDPVPRLKLQDEPKRFRPGKINEGDRMDIRPDVLCRYRWLDSENRLHKFEVEASGEEVRLLVDDGDTGQPYVNLTAEAARELIKAIEALFAYSGVDLDE